MKHVERISTLPARAEDNYQNPAEDGVISLSELMYMTMQALQALASFLLTKETAQHTP